jgi:hypothetical protein
MSIRYYTKIIIYNLILLIAICLSAELILRKIINYDAGYYSEPKKIINNINYHPYGKIPINKNGFYDVNWDSPKVKHRIGYFGDSVIYGVGTGYPYRITELMDEYKEDFEHINLSYGIGISLEYMSPLDLIKLTQKYEIDTVFYIMNLNDIAPIFFSQNKDNFIAKKSDSNNLLVNLKRNKFINFFDQKLRGRSYFYTFLRFQVKKILVLKFNYEASGHKAMELFPKKFKKNIEKTAIFLSKYSKEVNKFLNFEILILPYEMQISNDARKHYAKIGVRFEDEFINFETQKILKKKFEDINDKKIYILGKKFPEKKIGTYFVFNKGDKIDFNHPNKLGHEILSEEIANLNIFTKLFTN